MAHTIRVLVVDDHPLAHAGMHYFLAAFPDLHLIGGVSSGDEAIAVCRQQQPDIVLLDMLMPGIDGVETLRILRKLYPQMPILALSSSSDGELVERALRAGASGYVLKNISAFDLVQAIRSAYEGRSVLTPEAAESLAETMRRPSGIGEIEFTEREREVLDLMVKGLSNPQIADQLSISRATVKFHISSIFTKMNVNSRAEAMALVYRQRSGH